MTVLTEGKMVRDSVLVLFRHSSGDNALIGTCATAAEVFRYVGGSTLASSSEAYCALDKADHIGFLVGWAATGFMSGGVQLTANKGDHWRSGLGTVTFELSAHATGSTGAAISKFIAGPYESARFSKTATSTAQGFAIGTQYLHFSMTSACSSVSEAEKCNVKPFRWPDVQYDT